MNAHALALASFKRLKNAPYVGRAIRYAVARLKITFAAWHYSNNRLAVDLASPAALPGPPGENVAPDAVQAMARRLAVAEAMAVGDAAPGYGLVLEILDGDGLETRAEWRRGADLSRMVPFPGAKSVRVSRGVPSRSDMAALAEVVRGGGALTVMVADIVTVARAAEGADAARAAVTAACPAGWAPPEAVAAWMAQAGFGGVRTATVGDAIEVTGCMAA